MKKIILGSQSPRRKEILSFFKLPFLQAVSHFDEESIPFQGDPVAYSKTLAKGKAEALSSLYQDEIILTADTVVFLHEKIYNKPKDAHEAAQFLRELGGHWHVVHTALYLKYKDQAYSESEATRLLFYRLSEEEIALFHKHVHFLDKAGGYAIEGCGQLILDKMEGCYYNVLGLPINAMRRLFKKVGIDLWHYMKDVP
jgi:septum formation protein